MVDHRTSRQFWSLSLWYLLTLSYLVVRDASEDVDTRAGPRLQFKCVSGDRMIVVNPDPDRFKHAFVTLESETKLLETQWADSYKTLTIFLPNQIYNILIRFSTRPDVVIGNNGLIYRITSVIHGSGSTSSDSASFTQSDEGLQSVQSVVRLGSLDGKPVTEGVIREEDLFWTIQTFEKFTMKPLNCTISAGQAPFYLESAVIIINGCSTDHWIMDDFSRLQVYGNDSTLYYTKLHTFRFYSHTYLTVLCKIRVCLSELSHLCLIECSKMKRYLANEPGQPQDVMYTHIEFTLFIEYTNNNALKTTGEKLMVTSMVFFLLPICWNG